MTIIYAVAHYLANLTSSLQNCVPIHALQRRRDIHGKCWNHVSCSVRHDRKQRNLPPFFNDPWIGLFGGLGFVGGVAVDDDAADTNTCGSRRRKREKGVVDG